MQPTSSYQIFFWFCKIGIIHYHIFRRSKIPLRLKSFKMIPLNGLNYHRDINSRLSLWEDLGRVVGHLFSTNFHSIGLYQQQSICATGWDQYWIQLIVTTPTTTQPQHSSWVGHENDFAHHHTNSTSAFRSPRWTFIDHSLKWCDQ